MFRPAFEGQIPSLGYELGPWIEQALGITLTEEQRVRLLRLYRIDAVTGARVVRRAALRRPKGCGKSPEGAYLGFGELCGPVMFDGWDANGQPVARPRDVSRGDLAPWVQMAAVSEDQTDNVLVWLYDLLGDRPGTVDDLGVDVGRTRIYLRGRPGRIEPVTSAAGSREGQPVTFGVLDQTEAWKRENGGVRLAAVLRRNAAKTGGWTYELQNAPELGDGSVADLTARAWERGQSGVLFDTREPVKVPDLDDREGLLSALGEVYGEAIERGWVVPERLAEECVDADTEPSDAYRFYLNVARPAESRAFDLERWDELGDASRVVAGGALVALGFDGARFHDATALVGVEVESGHLFVVGVWERPDGVDGWEVPEAEVQAAVARAFDTWDVARFYADPPYWESQVDVWSGRWEQVARWWTNRNKPAAHAVAAFAGALRAGDLSHDGDGVLRAHVRNARRKELPRLRDDEGRPLWSIRKESAGSSLKIDAAMAAVLAWEARRDAIAAGVLDRRRKRSYAAVGF